MRASPIALLDLFEATEIREWYAGDLVGGRRVGFWRFVAARPCLRIGGSVYLSAPVIVRTIVCLWWFVSLINEVGWDSGRGTREIPWYHNSPT